MGKSEDLMKGIDRVGIFERMKDYEDMAFETRAIDVGNDSGRSAMPIYASVTGDTYQRHGDPSRDAISTCGVSAMTLPMLAVLKKGDRIICHKDLYIWTYFFVREDLPRLCDIQVDMVDFTDLNALEAALKKEPARMVVFETIANPLLHVDYMKACCELAHI